jgi:hypothetical protein
MNLDRGQFVEHKGKQILIADYSEMTKPAEVVEALMRVQDIIERQPPGSVRYLIDVTGTRFNTEVARTLKDLASRSKPFFRANAIVGLTGVQQVLYRTIAPLLGQRMPAFASRQDAMDWLAEQ